jgi:hypothetical protein
MATFAARIETTILTVAITLATVAAAPSFRKEVMHGSRSWWL